MELHLAKPLTICKTLVLSVDGRITTTKVKFLDKLTAWITYEVHPFLERITAENIARVKDAERYRHDIQIITGLSSAFVQACRDTALWMYTSYRRLHRDWQRDIDCLEKSITTCKERIAKKSTAKDKKRLRKLQHKLYLWNTREPSPPAVKGMVPVTFD